MNFREILYSETRKSKQGGFTVIELMIATTVFSLVLMGALAGIIQITKMYYQGITLIRTQEVSRAVSDEIGEALRFSRDYETVPIAPTPSPSDDTAKFICVGIKRYSYYIDKQLSQNPEGDNNKSRHVLWVDIPEDGCTSKSGAANLDDESPSLGNGGRELLAENMRLNRFEISKFSGSSDLYSVIITIVYGDDDLIQKSDTPWTCKNNFVGTEFCAVSNVSLTVQRRL